MTEQVGERLRQPEERRQIWLWFGVAAGPVIWALHLVVAYALQTLSCQWGFLQFNILGIHALRFSLIVITILPALIILYAGYISYGLWWKFRDERGGLNKPEEERFQFLAYSGVGLNGLFVVITLLKLVPVIVLPICS